MAYLDLIKMDLQELRKKLSGIWRVAILPK
jgi:hypothetical protein